MISFAMEKKRESIIDDGLFDEEYTCGCGRCECCEYEPKSDSSPVSGYRWLNPHIAGGWNKYNTHITLLVRALRPRDEGVFDHTENGLELYMCSEFFKAEVVFRPDSKVLHDFHYDPLLDCSDIGSFIRIGSLVYVIGSRFRPGYTISDSLTPEFSTKPIECLKGMSWLNLDSSKSGGRWNTGASPGLYNVDLRCAALDGKIYCLVSSFLDDSLVYHPEEDRWVNFDPKHPKSLSKCYVSPILIPDSTHKRILVYLYSATGGFSSIYAWYPQRHGHNWVCLKDDFIERLWKKKPTLVGDSLLVFFLRRTRELFRVLDLETGEWLRVKWSSSYGPHLHKHGAKTMFYMGDHQLCLCYGQHHLPPVSGSLVFIVIFELRRKSDSVVTFTHRFTKSFFTKHIQPVDFIPLS